MAPRLKPHEQFAQEGGGGGPDDGLHGRSQAAAADGADAAGAADPAADSASPGAAPAAADPAASRADSAGSSSSASASSPDSSVDESDGDCPLTGPRSHFGRPTSALSSPFPRALRGPILTGAADRVRQIVLLAVRHDEAGTGPHMHGQHKRPWRQPTIVTTDENGEIHNNNNLRQADEGNANELELYMLTVNDPRFETGQWQKKSNGTVAVLARKIEWDTANAGPDPIRHAALAVNGAVAAAADRGETAAAADSRSALVDCQRTLTTDIDVASLFLSACAVIFAAAAAAAPAAAAAALPPLFCAACIFPRPSAGIFFDNIETSAEQCTTERSVQSIIIFSRISRPLRSEQYEWAVSAQRRRAQAHTDCRFGIIGSGNSAQAQAHGGL